MIVLIGISEEITDSTPDGFEFKEIRTRLASFDTKELAEDYIEKSKSKDYNEHCTWRSSERQFKVGSLLNGQQYAEIESQDELPNNPEI